MPLTTLAEQEETLLEYFSPDEVDQLRIGTHLTKHGRQGVPHRRFFRIHLGNPLVLSYRSMKKSVAETSYSFDRIVDVLYGQETEVFQRHRNPVKENCSFSVVLMDQNKREIASPSRVRTLDVECDSPKQLKLWCGAICLLGNFSIPEKLRLEPRQEGEEILTREASRKRSLLDPFSELSPRPSVRVRAAIDAMRIAEETYAVVPEVSEVEYDQFFEVSASLLHLVESNPENAVDAIKHLVVESSMHVFARVIATSYQYPERGGMTLLQVALLCSRVDIASYLLDIGAQVCVLDSFGNTPLMQCVLGNNPPHILQRVLCQVIAVHSSTPSGLDHLAGGKKLSRSMSSIHRSWSSSSGVDSERRSGGPSSPRILNKSSHSMRARRSSLIAVASQMSTIASIRSVDSPGSTWEKTDNLPMVGNSTISSSAPVLPSVFGSPPQTSDTLVDDSSPSCVTSTSIETPTAEFDAKDTFASYQFDIFFPRNVRNTISAESQSPGEKELRRMLARLSLESNDNGGESASPSAMSDISDDFFTHESAVGADENSSPRSQHGSSSPSAGSDEERKNFVSFSHRVPSVDETSSREIPIPGSGRSWHELDVDSISQEGSSPSSFSHIKSHSTLSLHSPQSGSSRKKRLIGDEPEIRYKVGSDAIRFDPVLELRNSQRELLYISLNTLNVDGYNVLHHVDSPELVALIARTGLRLDVIDADGATALHTAARSNRVDVARVLLGDVSQIQSNRFSDLDESVFPGDSVLFPININVSDIAGNTPLHEAVRHGHEMMCILLRDAGARISPRNVSKSTPLHFAFRSDVPLSICELLIRAGAEVDARDVFGMTPFDLLSHRSPELSHRLWNLARQVQHLDSYEFVAKIRGEIDSHDGLVKLESRMDSQKYRRVWIKNESIIFIDSLSLESPEMGYIQLNSINRLLNVSPTSNPFGAEIRYVPTERESHSVNISCLVLFFDSNAERYRFTRLCEARIHWMKNILPNMVDELYLTIEEGVVDRSQSSANHGADPLVDDSAVETFRRQSILRSRVGKSSEFLRMHDEILSEGGFTEWFEHTAVCPLVKRRISNQNRLASKTKFSS